MLSGMKESYKKGESESILAPSPAAGIVRCPSKRRQGYCLGKLNLDTGNWTFHDLVAWIIPKNVLSLVFQRWG